MRPKEGETQAIEDTYGYNGDGLRISQTISGNTTYMAWELAESLPLILNDGTNSYVYGPGGLPVEQIPNEGAVLYIHHDQQGSTRLLTNGTGENVGSYTYDAYGNVLEKKGAKTTPLGYDGQYTDADTGLIYMRARYYDPATAQFLRVDPAIERTAEPYTYAQDDPVNGNDVTGLETQSEFAHTWARAWDRLTRLANRRHIELGLFQDYALTAFYAEMCNLSNESEYGRNYNAWRSYYVITTRHVVKAFEPLAVSAEAPPSPSSIIKALFQVAANVFGI